MFGLILKHGCIHILHLINPTYKWPKPTGTSVCTTAPASFSKHFVQFCGIWMSWLVDLEFEVNSNVCVIASSLMRIHEDSCRYIETIFLICFLLQLFFKIEYLHTSCLTSSIYFENEPGIEWSSCICSLNVFLFWRPAVTSSVQQVTT